MTRIAVDGIDCAGKSTLVDLIPRFYEPQQGTIRIDGVDTRDITLASLRARGLMSGLAAGERERVFALAFALQQLQQNLVELSHCVEDWARNPGWRGKLGDLARASAAAAAGWHGGARAGAAPQRGTDTPGSRRVEVDSDHL